MLKQIIKNKVLFIHLLIVVLVSMVILFFPFIKYEMFYNQYKIKTLPLSKSKMADLYQHSDLVSKRIANNVIQNKYEFQDKKSSFNPINDDINNIFSGKTYIENNTQKLYIHSLTILFDLIRAYEITPKEQYLIEGRQIIENWSRYNSRFLAYKKEYSWNDHATAIRLLACLSFWDFYKNKIGDKKLDDTINQLVNKSIAYLLNPFNYTENHNHGVFQDIALTFAALHLEDYKSKNILLSKTRERIDLQMKSLVSKENITLENSPGYHYVITNLLNTYCKILPEKYVTTDLKTTMSALNDNFGKFLRADFTLPSVGDTDPNVKYNSFSLKESGSFLSQQAGFYLDKKLPNYYFLARTQSINDSHIHQDKFSFILDWNNESIISECGFLSYQENSQREYSLSKSAHNTINILNKRNKLEDTYFSRMVEAEELTYLRIREKNDVEMYRDFFHLKRENILYIKDSFMQEHTFLRTFHLPKNIRKIRNIKYNEIEYTTKNNQKVFITTQEDSLFIVKGDNQFVRSFKAEAYTRLEPSYSIIQKVNRKSNTACIISLNSKAIINQSSDILKIIRGKDLFFLKEKRGKLKLNNKEFVIKNNKKHLENISFAVDKSWLSERYAMKFFKFIVITLFIYYFCISLIIVKMKQFYKYILILLPYSGLILLMVKVVL